MRALLLTVAIFTTFALASTAMCASARTPPLSSTIQSIDAEIATVRQAVRTREAEIGALERDAMSLQAQAAKIEQLAPHLFALAGERERASTELAAILARELAKLGASVSPDTLSALANAMGEGGQGAMAIAMIVSFAIAEASADAEFGSRSRASALPSLDQAAVSCHGSKPGRLAASPPARACIAILAGLTKRPGAIHLPMSIASTVAGLPAAKGVAVFLSGVGAQVAAQLSEINAAIESRKAEIGSLKQLIAQLMAQKAALQKEAE